MVQENNPYEVANKLQDALVSVEDATVDVLRDETVVAHLDNPDENYGSFAGSLRRSPFELEGQTRRVGGELLYVPGLDE